MNPRAPLRWLCRPLPVLLFALLVRLPGLLLGVEHYGDAPVRVEAAERWAAAPHLPSGFGEVYQYGPAHLMMLGSLLRLWPDRVLTPRLLSLACGLLGVWMLWLLTRRLRGEAAATLAALGLALDTVHLQSSSSAASEAVFLGLFLLCLELLSRAGALAPVYPPGVSEAEAPAHPGLIVAAGAALGLAGLVRYDGWILAALVCGLLLLRVLRKETRPAALLLFALVTALPALWWMRQNLLESGDALRPLHYINQDHRGLAEMGLRWFGPLRYRLYCAGYWPINVLLLSSPLLGLFSLLGAFRALRRRTPGWELAALAWVPAAYFTLRGALLADFRPMSRFVLGAAALSLPFAWDGMELLVARLGERLRRPLLGAAVAVAALVPLALFAASYHRDSALAEWARPLSPVSSVPPGIEQAALWLKAEVKPGEGVVLDSVWDYLEIPLAFQSGLPERQLIRKRYDNFDVKLTQLEPTVAVLIYQGDLQYAPGAQGASWENERFTLRGARFCRAARYQYASVYRRC